MSKKKKQIRKRVYVDVGSHGGVFEFVGGLVGDRYPHLLNVYNKKHPGLKPATLVYKVDS